MLPAPPVTNRSHCTSGISGLYCSVLQVSCTCLLAPVHGWGTVLWGWWLAAKASGWRPAHAAARPRSRGLRTSSIHLLHAMSWISGGIAT